MINIRHEAAPFVLAGLAVGMCVGFLCHSVWLGVILALCTSAGFLFFFRDPDRQPPQDESAVLSGADGRVMSVKHLTENQHLATECARISVFLSVFDVHVNRSPITGHAQFIGYFGGKKHFAFTEKSSETNQHNKILITGSQTRCLVAQIVGPVARRVVYWLDHDRPTPVTAGDRIGMMKFGSRLDVWLPLADVEVLVKPGDRVRAGETVLARVKNIDKR